MPTQYFVSLVGNRPPVKRPPGKIGNKALNLWRLSHKGFHVPAAWVCTWQAYEQYAHGSSEILEILAAQLRQFTLHQRTYAVRSSADIEDSFEHTFAGQFTSRLNVCGPEEVLHALRAVWDQTSSPEVQQYLQRLPAGRRNIRMAVIIQEMVQPVVSGVSFSKNPLTGLSETLVEAVIGSGEQLVQDGVTPQRWVYRSGDWLDSPQSTQIPQELIQEVVEGTQQISQAFKRDVDLEWVYDGSQLYWVQMREITSLGELPVYSSKIAKDMLPGIIKPLVWSVNTPIVNGAWLDLISEVIGPNEIDPMSLSKSFYYRAYFNMGTFGRIFERLGMPADSLERMRGQSTASQSDRRSMGGMMKPGARTFALLPRLLRFMRDKWRFAHQIEKQLPQIEAGYREIAARTPLASSTQQLLDEIARLKELTHQAAYFNIVAPLLMGLYNSLLRRQVEDAGIDYQSLDLMAGVEEIHRFDPGFHLEQLHLQFEQLDPQVKQSIRNSSYADLSQLAGEDSFLPAIAHFIEQFGHLSDSGTDFSSRPWRESPDLILQMIANYSPSQRKESLRISFEQLPARGVRRLWMRVLFERTRQFRLYRDQISSLYTFGYGLFRNYYLALGEELVRQGNLETQEDVFYLYEHELYLILEAGQSALDARSLVSQRKLEIKQVLNVDLPEVIYGDQPPPVSSSAGRFLRGTPTSRGYHTGMVKNVRGIQDFPAVNAGDVVVVPYSDVGWTPLFARAGAVIAEAGGILSHCSIVAREYGIPAVVSVAGVAQLKDDLLVTVDGYKGEIILHEAQDQSTSPESGE